MYFEISKSAIELAQEIKEGFVQKGYQLYLDSPTNQQFIIMENEQVEKLKEKVNFAVWERFDKDHKIVRFVTSWATTKEDVVELLSLI